MTIEKKAKGKKKASRSGSRDAFFWWAITGSNWFRSEHHLKEQSDAQMIVSRGCRRLYDRREKRKKARKKTAWSRSHEVFFWWAMTGSNCRHSACKADALPAELIAHKSLTQTIMP